MSKRKRDDIPDSVQLRAIKDAADQSRSSSFKLQIDALLSSTQPNQNRIPSIERFLRELHKVLLEIRPGITEAFIPPSNITIVGSWPITGACIKKRDTGFAVDVAIQIPGEMLNEKDHINTRFEKKRRAFLKGLKSGVEESELNVDVRVVEGLLMVRHRKDGTQTDFTRLSAHIRLIPTLSASDLPFPVEKLSPSHSPTALLALHPVSSLLITHALTKRCAAFCSTKALLQIWSSQRLVASLQGMFWGTIIDAVLEEKGVGAGATAYQLFKACLDYVSQKDLSIEPVFLAHKYDNAAFDLGPRLIDRTGLLNILHDTPEGVLSILRQDASHTISLLSTNSNDEEVFSELFLKDRRSLFARFDTVLRLPSNSTINLKKACSILRTGLGNRCTLVHLTATHILLCHDPTHFGRLVDHGPAPLTESSDGTDTNGDAFRVLWGPKSELRRFKDGRINEAVVWENVTSRFMVPSTVAAYLMDHHFSMQLEHISYEEVLPIVGIESSFRETREAFEQVLKVLKSLDEKDGLPLRITALSPASPLLRSTSPFPAQDKTCTSGWSEPIDVIMEYEKNTKWPDDLEAIQNVKLALLERTAACLMQKDDSMKAQVVVSPFDKASVILEIITPGGWILHSRVWYDRELKLLSTQKSKWSDYQASIMYRNMVHAPRHHRAVASLTFQHPAFAPTVRLAIRWLSSHWVFGGSRCIRVEVVELICASLFTGQGRHIPGTREVGLARFVEFLSEWRWEEDGGDLSLQLQTRDSTTESSGDLSQEHEAVPLGRGGKGVWTIRSDLDPDGRVWTSEYPDTLVALRIRDLAQATWKVLKEMELSILDVKPIFTHPTHDYDFIAHLNVSVLPRHFQRVNQDLGGAKTRYANRAKDIFSRNGMDPAQMLFNELSQGYADTFRVFYDPFGGDQFGCIWDPTLHEPRKFKTLSGYSSRPCRVQEKKNKGMVELNKEALLDELRVLGTGIVHSIDEIDK